MINYKYFSIGLEGYYSNLCVEIGEKAEKVLSSTISDTIIEYKSIKDFIKAIEKDNIEKFQNSDYYCGKIKDIIYFIELENDVDIKEKRKSLESLYFRLILESNKIYSEKEEKIKRVAINVYNEGNMVTLCTERIYPYLI